MSHTFVFNKTTFISNGDLSGDVEIRHGNDVVIVPAENIKAFVGDWVRRTKIVHYETAPTDDVLLGKL